MRLADRRLIVSFRPNTSVTAGSLTRLAALIKPGMVQSAQGGEGMAWSKAKNIIILILAAADLLLCVLAIPLWKRQRLESQQLGQELSALLADRGVALDPASLPGELDLGGLELQHGSDRAAEAVTALLGTSILMQDDSNRYQSTYRGVGGSCVFSHNGHFSAQITNPPASQGSLEADAAALLEAMGFQVARLELEGPDQEGRTLVRAWQTLLGAPVFGPGLSLTYRDGLLTGVEGVFYAYDQAPALVSEDTCISAADALVAFLNGRAALGWVGSQVLAVEQGWLETETPSAANVRLTPVWRIVTDTATLYVNGLTKALSVSE